MKAIRRAFRAFVWIVACFLTLHVPEATLAQSKDEYPSLNKPTKVEGNGASDVAVIVAIEDYAFLPDVRGAVANGNDWEAFFRQGLGVNTVHFVSNQSATNDEMRRFAAMAAKDVGKEGTLWFVFIGHGAPDAQNADGILVGMDAQQSTTSLATRGLFQQELLDILGKGKQKQTVVVVDACFSGRDGSGNALVEAQPVLPVNFQPKVKEHTTVILSAAQAREFAGPLPGLSRPAFSYLLLGALRGWAVDGKGSVRAKDAVWYTQKVLRGIPGRFDQSPSIHGNGNLVLVRGAGEKDPGIRALMERKLRQPVASLATVPSTVTDPENTTVGRTSLGDLDLEQLRQLEAMSKAIREAEALEKDKGATVKTRLTAWERAAGLPVEGGNPYASDALARAAHWRKVAASLPQMRTDWATVRELLDMEVVAVSEKRLRLEEFLSAYRPLDGEPELKLAHEALALLGEERAPTKNILTGMKSSFKMGVPQVGDSCDTSAIREIVYRRQGALRRCYENELQTNPGLSGQITAQWKVSLEGMPIGVSIAETSLNKESVENCITRVIGGFRFPKPDGRICFIQYPLIFGPSLE